jgi:thiamine-phosphate pyrophosphorylase
MSAVEPGDNRVPRDASLYLDFEIASGPHERVREVMAAVLDTAAISSVLIRSYPDQGNDTAAGTTATRALIAFVQKRNIAALILADAANASQLGADGMHVPWTRDVVRQFKELRAIAATGTILGGDAGRSRHDAMQLGEAGADYVAFGIPPHVEDRVRAVERQIDLISWWSRIFEVPCVAFDVADANQARQLVEAGADFISVRLSSHEPTRDAVERVRAFSNALKVHERSE